MRTMKHRIWVHNTLLVCGYRTDDVLWTDMCETRVNYGGLWVVTAPTTACRGSYINRLCTSCPECFGKGRVEMYIKFLIQIKFNSELGTFTISTPAGGHGGAISRGSVLVPTGHKSREDSLTEMRYLSCINLIFWILSQIPFHTKCKFLFLLLWLPCQLVALFVPHSPVWTTGTTFLCAFFKCQELVAEFVLKMFNVSLVWKKGSVDCRYYCYEYCKRILNEEGTSALSKCYCTRWNKYTL